MMFITLLIVMMFILDVMQRKSNSFIQELASDSFSPSRCILRQTFGNKV